MATRSEKLNRLVIQSPCKKGWEEMTGDDAERHCAQCDRQVFNFQSMTPRQIAARVEASHGNLCGRITRGGDGRLLTLEPPFEPMAPSTFTAQRVSPVVAVVTDEGGTPRAGFLIRAVNTLDGRQRSTTTAGDRAAGRSPLQRSRAGPLGAPLSL